MSVQQHRYSMIVCNLITDLLENVFTFYGEARCLSWHTTPDWAQACPTTGKIWPNTSDLKQWKHKDYIYLS